MLIQQPTRFRWDDVLHGYKPNIRFAPEYNGHLVTGVVRDRDGKPMANALTYLTVPGKHFRFATCLSDAAGFGHYELKDFYGPANLVVQTADSLARVELLSPFSEAYANRTVDRQPLVYKARFLIERSTSMQVQNRFHADSLRQFQMPPYDTLPFFGMPDASYGLDLYKRFPTIEEVLREYVRQVNVRIRDGKKEMAVVDEVARVVYNNPPLVIVDGIPLLDPSHIFDYDRLQVRRIDVVTKKFYSGVSVYDGIVSFVTYNGDYLNLQLPPEAMVVDYEGLQLRRLFYSPQYETDQQRTSRLPDLRELLFWTPEIGFDNQGKAEISFYFRSARHVPGSAAGHGRKGKGRVVVRNEVLEVR